MSPSFVSFSCWEASTHLQLLLIVFQWLQEQPALRLDDAGFSVSWSFPHCCTSNVHKVIHIHGSDYVCQLFYLLSVSDGTSGLTDARQVLYYWITPPSTPTSGRLSQVLCVRPMNIIMVEKNVLTSIITFLCNNLHISYLYLFCNFRISLSMGWSSHCCSKSSLPQKSCFHY